MMSQEDMKGINMVYFYNKSIAESIRAFLEFRHIRYEFCKSLGVFSFHLRSNPPSSSHQCAIAVSQQSFNVYCISPQTADYEDEKQMLELSRLFHIVNCGVDQGCFEIRITSGKIRYRVSRYCVNDSVAFSMISSALELCQGMIELYDAAILSVIFELASGEEAAEMVREKNRVKAKETNAGQGRSADAEKAVPEKDAIGFFRLLLDAKPDEDDAEFRKRFSA